MLHWKKQRNIKIIKSTWLNWEEAEKFLRAVTISTDAVCIKIFLSFRTILTEDLDVIHALNSFPLLQS